MKSSWENRQWWLWGLCVVLLFGGYLVGMSYPHRFDKLLLPSLNQLRQLAQQTNAFHSVFRTVAVIFLHNLFAGIVVMTVSGIITVGIYPAWAMWMNGLTMGYVVAIQSSGLGVPAWRIFVYGMLPHGVFELPAFIWCGVIGMQLGYVAIHSVWHILTTRLVHEGNASTRHVPPFRRQLRIALKTLPYPVGLLLIAATIEGTVTPHLILTGIPHIH